MMSPKSVTEKLRIASGATLWSSHPDRLDLIGPLPPQARVVARPEEASAAIVFGDDAASLRKLIAQHAGALRDRDLVWVAYPKGNRSDINRDSLWPILAEHGLRPIGQVALDEAWSALRFRALAPGEEFKGGAGS
jgi:hypothetical protein